MRVVITDCRIEESIGVGRPGVVKVRAKFRHNNSCSKVEMERAHEHTTARMVIPKIQFVLRVSESWLRVQALSE
jgi:hypothetical protein